MTRNLIYALALLSPIPAILCARGAKGLGQKIAVTWFTITTSVIATIDKQVRAFGRAGGIATVLIAIGLALMLLAPSSAMWWAGFVSTLLGFCSNLALGFSAGVGTNVAEILEKVSARDSIKCAIEMKLRTRRQLQRFIIIFCVVGIIIGGIAPASAADRVWAWAIDISDSMDPSQRAMGIDAMVRGAYDRAHELDADVILVIKFSDGIMLSDMNWIRVPSKPHLEDCERVTPNLVISEGLIGLSPVGAWGRKQDAIEACLARNGKAEQLMAEQKTQVRTQLELATKVRPRTEGRSRIVPLLLKLVSRTYLCAIDALTDGIDNSGVPLSSLRIPKGLPFTVVLTRPNPSRKAPSLDQVLTAAEGWARIPGISVTSVSEYAVFTHSSGGR